MAEILREVRGRHSNDLEAAIELGIDRATFWTWKKVLGVASNTETSDSDAVREAV